MTTRIRADIDASMASPTPGDVYVVCHVDGRNRLVYFQPAAEVGGPAHLPGYHVVGASHHFGFIADAQDPEVSVDGRAVRHNGVVHQVVGRHQAK